MTGTEDFPTYVQKESIKLCKNVKSYTWEIKTLDMDLDRLEKLNQELIDKYGGIVEA